MSPSLKGRDPGKELDSMIEKQTKSGHWELCLKVVPLYFYESSSYSSEIEKKRVWIWVGG